MKYSIYVPSKGRYDKNYTIELFLKHNIDFKIVVEPQEAHHYFNAFGGDNLLVIDDNDAGDFYVRNWIKEYSTKAGEAFHWQIDDDMKAFKRRVGNKNVKINPKEALLEIEREVDKYSNIGQAGLSSDVFAFSSTKDICINRQIYSVMLFNNSLPFKFRDGVIVDLDYSLQVLYSGLCTLFFTRIMFQTITPMKQKGGNTDDYKKGKRDRHVLGLTKEWPDITRVYETKNGLKAYTGHLWRKFPQRPALKETNEP